MQNTVKIGLCAVVHPNMHGDDRGLYKKIIKSLEPLKEKLSFELYLVNEPLESESDGVKARNFFDDKRVDLTLIFNASLGYGRVVLPLAKVNSFIGLWSVPEPTKSGVLQLNSFCGLNMYGAIIANYLREYDIPFKWFYGYPESEMFLERFRVSLRSIRAVKALEASRIGLVGDIADGFENFVFDERTLERKFGTYIQTRHTVEDIVGRAKAIQKNRVEKELETILREGEWKKNRVSKEEMDKFARVNLAFLDFAKEFDYNALCISCWSKFQEIYDIAVCGAMSRLNEAGIVAPCEGDVPGALVMLALNALTGNISTINDLVSLDEADSSINMWHCGVASKSWACSNCVQWDAHFNIGNYENDEWHGRGVIADFDFQPGPVTVSRLNNSFDKLFVFQGNVMEGKESYYGASGWINDLNMKGQSLNIPDLINTIMVNHVDHHYPMVYGEVENELVEFAGWKNIAIAERIPYQVFMQR